MSDSTREDDNEKDRTPDCDDDVLREVDRIEKEYLDGLANGKARPLSELVGGYPHLAPRLERRLRLALRLRHGLADKRADRSSIPKQIGAYPIVGVLGEGASGVVLRAHDPMLDRPVAIKLLRSEIPPDSNVAIRLQQREPTLIARLRHANIVPVYSSGLFEGRPYLVMELIEGRTLSDVLVGSPGATPDFRWTAELVRKIADALHFAHTRGIIHRDVKPSNILLDESNEPQLADFGLASSAGDVCSAPEPPVFSPSTIPARIEDSPSAFGCSSTGEWSWLAGGAFAIPDVRDKSLTQTHQILGTPNYMCPAQAAGRPQDVDAQGDVFSLGIVLYRMLTGRLPFEGSPDQVREGILCANPAPPRCVVPAVPLDLNAICLRALAKRPPQCYRTAADFAGELQRWLQGLPLVFDPPRWPRRGVRWCRRNPKFAALAALLLILSVVAAAAAAFAVAEGKARSEALIRARIAEGHDLLELPTHESLQEVRNKILPQTVAELQNLSRGSVYDELRVEIRSLFASLLGMVDVEQTASLEMPRTTPLLRWPVAIHPAGEWLAVAAADRPFRIDINGGETLDFPDSPANRPPAAKIAFSSTGKYVLLTRGRTVEVWRGDLSGLAGAWQAHSVSTPIATVLFEERKSLLIVSNDGMLRRLSVPGLVSEFEHQLGSAPMTALVAEFDCAGGRIAVGDEQGGLAIYDATDGNLLKRLPGDSQPTLVVAWSPNGRLIGSGHKGGRIVVRDVETWNERFRLREWPDLVEAIVFSPDDRWIAAGRHSVAGSLFDANSGKTVISGLLTPAGFSRNGQILAGSVDGRVQSDRIVAPLTVRRLTGHRASIEHLVWSGDGSMFATLDSDFVLRIWRADTGCMVREISLPGHSLYAQNAGLALNDDGRMLALALSKSSGGAFQIINLETGAEHEWSLPPGYGRVAHIGGNRFVSVREERERVHRSVVRTFSSAGGEEGKSDLRESLPSEVGFLQQMLTRDGRLYVWVGPREPIDSFRIEVWDVAQGNCVVRLPQGIFEKSRGEPRAFIADGGQHLWTFNPSDEHAPYRLRDIASGRETVLPSRSTPPVAMSPDGMWRLGVMPVRNRRARQEVQLCTGTDEGPWVKFALPAGKNVSDNAAAFSPDNRFVAWGDQSGDIVLVNLVLLKQEVDRFESALAAP